MANLYRSVLNAAGTAPTGDALAADVLTGKTFSNADGVGLSGSMPNNGAVSQTIAAGASYTIPEGYHNGSGVLTAVMPTFTTNEQLENFENSNKLLAADGTSLGTGDNITGTYLKVEYNSSGTDYKVTSMIAQKVIISAMFSDTAGGSKLPTTKIDTYSANTVIGYIKGGSVSAIS